MPSRARIVIAFLVLLDLVLIGCCWTFRANELTYVWYLAIASRPMSVAEAEAIGACRDPGWWGWVRILEQDLDVHCGSQWMTETIAADVGPRRAVWLTRIALHPGRPPRERRRVGLVLLVSGQPPIRGLSLLLSEPDVLADERAYVAATLSPDDTWADPSLQMLDVHRRFLDDDPDTFQQIADELRIDAAGSPPEDLPRRLEHALSLTDLAGLERWRRRRANHLPLGDVPPGLARRLENDPKLCLHLEEAACVDLIADHLVEQLEADGEGEPVYPEVPVPPSPARPLWDAITDLQTADAHAREFGRYARWIGQANRDEGALRLLGLVAHRRNGFTAEVARTGALGDPTAALRWRRSGPWTTALAAESLGEMGGFKVDVRAVGDGVVLAVGGHRVSVGPCGTSFPLPEASSGEKWPPAAILAQAAIEGTGAALRARNLASARRLAVLAERSDPLGAAGVVDIVETLAEQIGRPPVGPVGYVPDTERVAGTLGRMFELAGTTPSGADADRKARAMLLDHALDQWKIAPDPRACPTPLGP
jgi:hypothetical protein